MPRANSPADKIHDHQLRSFVADKAPGERQVFIVLDLPALQVEFRTIDTGSSRRQVPARIRPETPAERKRAARMIASVRKVLAGVLHEEPVWMAGAGAFVAKVTSEELSAVVASPLVKEILPNRQFHIRGRGR
jgi:hypothetical protein